MVEYPVSKVGGGVDIPIYVYSWGDVYFTFLPKILEKSGDG
jgi:hypothetical protein